MMFGKRIMRVAGMLVLQAGFLFALGCGGSSSPKQVITPPTNNAVALTVSAGPLNNYTNGLFTTVTVCVPGSTTSCDTIDNVLVDTGSYGLRVVSASAGGKLTVSLPKETSGGNPIGECLAFLGGTSIWGPVMTADVQIAGEKASSVPVQVIGDTSLASVPSDCSSQGTPMNDFNSLTVNGFLGIGPFTEDCGDFCAPGTGDSRQNAYFVCPSTGCVTGTAGFVSVAQQVSNPVSFFATDNNGTIIELPSVGSSGAVSITGTLVFGIGTQSNNALGSAKVLTLDNSALLKSVTFKGVTYPNSSSPNSLIFIDSGSNAYFFLDSNTTGLPGCPANVGPDFYCPSSTQNLSATNQGQNGTSNSVKFSVANLANLKNPVLSNVAGPQPGDFDWGLSFFFGRNVFTAIAGKTAPGGTPPYVAY